MKIRFATHNDCESVLLLLNELGKVINDSVFYEAENEQVDKRGKEIYDSVIKRRDIKIFVVEEGNQIIALASFYILPDLVGCRSFAHMDDFVVTHKLRGKGIGTELLLHIKKYCKKVGIKTLKLTSSTQLTRAHQFYEKNGGIFSQKVIKFDIS